MPLGKIFKTIQWRGSGAAAVTIFNQLGFFNFAIRQDLKKVVRLKIVTAAYGRLRLMPR